MKVSIIVPSSRPDTVPETIQSLIQQDFDDFELLVVGQGDVGDARTIATKEAITRASNDRRVHYVHSLEKGATRGRNCGMMAATGEILAFIDDDCAANKNWLSVLVSTFDRDPDLGLVGGAVVAPQRMRRGFARCPTVSPHEVVYEPEKMGRKPPRGWCWISCNVAIKREVALGIGKWDEHLGPGTEFPAADDTDYLLRAEALNIKMATTPKAIVCHTYGYRYNQQLIKHIKNYNYGNGGLAGKLSLMGDPRGVAWLSKNRDDRLFSWLWPPRPDKGLRGLFAWRQFSAAYEQCIRNYRVEGDLLHPLTIKRVV